MARGRRAIDQHQPRAYSAVGVEATNRGRAKRASLSTVLGSSTCRRTRTG